MRYPSHSTTSRYVDTYGEEPDRAAGGRVPIGPQIDITGDNRNGRRSRGGTTDIIVAHRDIHVHGGGLQARQRHQGRRFAEGDQTMLYGAGARADVRQVQKYRSVIVQPRGQAPGRRMGIHRRHAAQILGGQRCAPRPEPRSCPMHHEWRAITASGARRLRCRTRKDRCGPSRRWILANRRPRPPHACPDEELRSGREHRIS